MVGVSTWGTIYIKGRNVRKVENWSLNLTLTFSYCVVSRTSQVYLLFLKWLWIFLEIPWYFIFYSDTQPHPLSPGSSTWCFLGMSLACPKRTSCSKQFIVSIRHPRLHQALSLGILFCSAICLCWAWAHCSDFSLLCLSSCFLPHPTSCWDCNILFPFGLSRLLPQKLFQKPGLFVWLPLLWALLTPGFLYVPRLLGHCLLCHSLVTWPTQGSRNSYSLCVK